MMKTVKVIAGGALAAAILLSTGSAMATPVYAVNGKKELVATAWAPAAKDPGKVAVRDESAGNWVKAEYYRVSSNDKRTSASEAQAADALCAQTPGNSAGACLSSGPSYKQVTLWDNECDGHRVYAEFWIGLTKHSFKPATQCKRNYSKKIHGWHSTQDAKIRVCVEDWGRNTCSRWQHGWV